MNNKNTGSWGPKIIENPIIFNNQQDGGLMNGAVANYPINPVEAINQFDSVYGLSFNPNTSEGCRALNDRFCYVRDITANQQKFLNECAIEGIRHQHAMQLEYEKTMNRKEIAEYSARLKESQLEGIERRKEKRLNSVLKLSMDENGVLETTSISPDGKPNGIARRLISVTHIRMTLIYPRNFFSEKVAVITWDGIEEELILTGEHFSPIGLGKGFSKYGVRIHCGGTYKKEHVESIWSYLIKNSTRIDKVAFLGWNHTKEGWVFQDNNEETFEGFLGGIENER